MKSFFKKEAYDDNLSHSEDDDEDDFDHLTNISYDS